MYITNIILNSKYISLAFYIKISDHTITDIRGKVKTEEPMVVNNQYNDIEADWLESCIFRET